jgi:hypothetical protein
MSSSQSCLRENYRLGDFVESRRAIYKATQFKKILQVLETVTEL